MPTYEYTCAACKHDFERFESITAKPNKLCPKCNKKKAERRISGGGGFLFKGTGFYITDYKKGGKSKPESKPAECKAEEGKSCGAEACQAKTTDSKTSDTKAAPTKSDSKSGKTSAA